MITNSKVKVNNHLKNFIARRLDLKDAQTQAWVMALKDTEPGELTKIIEEVG